MGLRRVGRGRRALTCASVQATEPIVRFALRTGKPWAVVPCCVWAEESPHRRLHGQPVRSYAQFLDWLVALDPDRIQTADLPFEGRRTVVYSTG